MLERSGSSDAKFLDGVTDIDPVKKVIDESFRFDVDPNLVHIRNYLNSEPEYRTRVRSILEKGPMPATPINQELAVLGIVKLGSDRQYSIRNKLYEYDLQNYFKDHPEV